MDSYLWLIPLLFPVFVTGVGIGKEERHYGVYFVMWLFFGLGFASGYLFSR